LYISIKDELLQRVVVLYPDMFTTIIHTRQPSNPY